MADINLDNLNEEFERASRSLEGFNTGLINSSNSAGILSNATKISAAAITREAKARDEYSTELKRGAKDIGSAVKGMAIGLAQGQTGLQSMSGVINATTKAVGGLLGGIPLFGGILKGAAEAVAETSKVMIDQLAVGWEAFRGLSDTGIVSTFGKLKELGDATGMRYEQINASLGKYSNSLVMLGGSTLEGANRFARLAKGAEEIRGQFYKMGINAQDFGEFQIKYMDDMARAGRLQGKTDAQLIQGTKDYILELDTIAKLTGASRKTIQDQRNAALADAKFAATTMNMNKEVRDSILNLSSYIENIGKDPAIAKGFRDAISGVYNTPESKAFLQQTGTEGRMVVDRMRKGTMSVAEGANLLQDAFKRNTQKVQQLGSAIGGGTMLTQNLPGQINLARAQRVTKEVLDSIKESQDKTDEQTEALADANKAVDKSAINLQQLATSSTGATKAVAGFAKTIESLTNKINSTLGISSPGAPGAPGAGPAPQSFGETGGGAATGGARTGRRPPSGGAPPAAPPAPPASSSPAAARGIPTGGRGKFYNEMYNTLYAEAKKAGVPNPEVIAHLGASQSVLETGNGKHLAGGNNYFGIKSHGRAGGKVVSTDDWVNGRMVNRKQSFRSYGSMQESAADYINFLQTNKRYAGLFRQTNVRDAINLQETTGYAAPGYGPKLQKIYDQNVGGGQTGGVTVASAPMAQAQVAAASTSRKESDGSIVTAVMNKLDDISSLLQRSLSAQQKIATNTN